MTGIGNSGTIIAGEAGIRLESTDYLPAGNVEVLDYDDEIQVIPYLDFALFPRPPDILIHILHPILVYDPMSHTVQVVQRLGQADEAPTGRAQVFGCLKLVIQREKARKLGVQGRVFGEKGGLAELEEEGLELDYLLGRTGDLRLLQCHFLSYGILTELICVLLF